MNYVYYVANIKKTSIIVVILDKFCLNYARNDVFKPSSLKNVYLCKKMTPHEAALCKGKIQKNGLATEKNILKIWKCQKDRLLLQHKHWK